MQMTQGAVTMVNHNTPKGVHYEHSEMKDPEKNIQCETYYLDIAKNNLPASTRATVPARITRNRSSHPKNA